MASAQRSNDLGGVEPAVRPGSNEELQKARSQSGGGENPFEALAEEALGGLDGISEEDLEAKAREALECPCIDGIKNGPCGASFVDAFVCYIKSREEEKGSDCLEKFVAMQSCMVAHPEILEEMQDDEES
ncbi:hypothetical protein KFL_000130500 [Klebsormidium nitens]|uniref:CHCH domain-containing protein n=1 Tax=Klebsormidium nitens TaxID=105231 RepID=A0A1Y1HPG1_KLENI|nr:hypothetical protein KFL_000130500 [Klebsormidium nitens]|eukprot:GAQ78467.1 hypothetical protein KFL_000130500 [Klebsormidium nitens]